MTRAGLTNILIKMGAPGLCFSFYFFSSLEFVPVCCLDSNSRNGFEAPALSSASWGDDSVPVSFCLSQNLSQRLLHSANRTPAFRTSKDDGQVSPTSTVSRGNLPPSSSSNLASHVSAKDRRLSDLTNYRRDLAVLEPTRSQPPPSTSSSSHQQLHPQHLPQHSHSVGNLGASSQIAPWMSSSLPAGASPKGLSTSFYNDSSDSLSMASQFSPGLPSATGRPGTGSGSISQEYADALYYNLDGRRPSAASVVTTASSQGSKTSANRGGFRKLQGFFGEEFPGRDSSESSLPISVPSKDQRSRSYSHGRPTQRDRNYSNATDREASPSSSRPRTPVPNPEVVPFLYQDNTVSRLFFLFFLTRCVSGALPHQPIFISSKKKVPATKPYTVPSPHPPPVRYQSTHLTAACSQGSVVEVLTQVPPISLPWLNVEFVGAALCHSASHTFICKCTVVAKS